MAASRPLVYVTRHIPQAALDILASAADLEVWPDELPPPPDQLPSLLAAADGVLSMLTDRIDDNVLAGCPKLRVVAQMAVGYDNVEIAAATRRGILVTNTPGVLTDATADLTLALLLAIARRIVEAAEYARAGRWTTWGPLMLVGAPVAGATLGIVGLGRIGAAVARRARGFGMNISYHSRTRQPDLERELGVRWHDRLDGLLAEADFVSLHVPGGAATQHLIDAAALARMKPSAYVINVARGPVVDTAALLDALQRGVIAGAALDVTDPEPLPADHPLYQLANCLIVPHIGSADLTTRTRMATMAATNLVEALAGRLPPNCVNPEAFARQHP